MQSAPTVVLESTPIDDYKQLVVWQKGFLLARVIYRLTSGFPAEERFGLTSQMRRSAVSIPSNIAEGQSRQSTKEFIQFISHAQGPTAELETQLLLSIELSYCSRQQASEALGLAVEIRKMLARLRQKLLARR